MVLSVIDSRLELQTRPECMVPDIRVLNMRKSPRREGQGQPAGRVRNIKGVGAGTVELEGNGPSSNVLRLHVELA